MRVVRVEVKMSKFSSESLCSSRSSYLSSCSASTHTGTCSSFESERDFTSSEEKCSDSSTSSLSQFSLTDTASVEEFIALPHSKRTHLSFVSSFDLEIFLLPV